MKGAGLGRKFPADFSVTGELQGNDCCRNLHDLINCGKHRSYSIEKFFETSVTGFFGRRAAAQALRFSTTETYRGVVLAPGF
jgi:hypothetical protein